MDVVFGNGDVCWVLWCDVMCGEGKAMEGRKKGKCVWECGRIEILS